MDNDIAAWVMVMIGVLAFSAVFYWLHGMVFRARMMRCPETGSVTFIHVKSAAPDAARACEVTVKQCDLWPNRKGCSQGCLARYWETTDGLRGNLEALRPFEPR